MAAPQYSDDDLASRLIGMLPRGKVWPRDFDTIMTATMRGCAPTWQRICQRVSDLIVDAFPATTVELLPEWEATLGLPDPCAGVAPTILQRQQQVLARFIATGGQSAAYFIALAAALGYDITITEYIPAQFGMRFGNRFLGDGWAYTWQINAPLYGPRGFIFGANRFGDPFSTYGNEVLECEMNRVKPAHTILLFKYS
jgi:uncharacterized protein YmfQ (DUF2313 family)